MSLCGIIELLIAKLCLITLSDLCRYGQLASPHWTTHWYNTNVQTCMHSYTYVCIVTLMHRIYSDRVECVCN